MKHYAQNIQSNYTLIKWGVNEMERFIGTIAISALFIFGSPGIIFNMLSREPILFIIENCFNMS